MRITKTKASPGWRRHMVRLNNWLIRVRRIRVQPKNLLLLVPHCLQGTGCQQAVKDGIDRCRRCGQCDVGGLIAIRDRYGILCNLANGGRQALDFLRDPAVKAVVAVACEQELADGIRAALPTPVLAVPNTRPNGPCKGTGVPLEAVEAAVRSLLILEPGTPLPATDADGKPATSGYRPVSSP